MRIVYCEDGNSCPLSHEWQGRCCDCPYGKAVTENYSASGLKIKYNNMKCTYKSESSLEK